MNLELKWITGEEKMGVEMVEWANQMGEKLTRESLTTSQIRKFYGEIKRIDQAWSTYREDIPMLNAKLAYAVGRKHKGKGINIFAKTFYSAIMKASESEENFGRLVKVLEATVAYHKFHGGQD